MYNTASVVTHILGNPLQVAPVSMAVKLHNVLLRVGGLIVTQIRVRVANTFLQGCPSWDRKNYWYTISCMQQRLIYMTWNLPATATAKLGEACIWPL